MWPHLTPRTICLIEIGLLVLKKKKIFSNINTCKNDFPDCGPTQPPGTMICTNLNFHYIRPQCHIAFKYSQENSPLKYPEFKNGEAENFLSLCILKSENVIKVEDISNSTIF
jgi:hypothetical protein